MHPRQRLEKTDLRHQIPFTTHRHRHSTHLRIESRHYIFDALVVSRTLHLAHDRNLQIAPGKQWADDYSSLVTAALLQHVGGSLVVMPEGCAKKFSPYVVHPLSLLHMSISSCKEN